MSTDPIRINARLTGDDARRFRELQEREGLGASDLLREALREYHAAHARPRANPATLLARAGLIGAFDDAPDLSTRYKDHLAEALEHKHPLRVQDR